MHRKFIATALAAIVAIVAAESAAMAGGCGCTTTPACAAPCADACCFPKVRYRTEWQTVMEPCKKTCYRIEHKTVMKECKEIVCKPVYENKTVDCKKIVCKPVWEEKQVKVCTGEWKVEQHVCPGPVVTRKCRLPDTCCFDPCTCTSKRIKGETVCYQEQLPGKTVCKKVWVPKEEVRTVKVCKMVQEEVVEKVNVQTCRWEKQEVVKQVPVTVCEKVPYEVTVNVCRKVKVCVPVCECCRPSLLDNLRGKLSGLFHRDCVCSTCGSSPCGCGSSTTVTEPVKTEKMPAPKSE